MPPRKSARAASKAAGKVPATPPLNCLKISLSGTFQLKQADITSKLESLGAIVLKSVTQETTHLISTSVDYEKNTIKVKQAKSLNIPIVSLSWMEESIASNSKVDESKHALGAALVASSGTTTVNAKKRTAVASVSAPAADAEDDEDEPQPKKTRAASSRGQTTKSTAPTPTSTAVTNGAKRKANGKRKEKTMAAATAEPENPDVEMADAQASKKMISGEQKAKSADLKVPVDECCPLVNYTVYVDPVDSMIWDAALNQTNAGNNNNKFYKIQILTDGNVFKVWTRWGRVGERGQNALLGNGSLADAIKNFEKKFKDKSGLNWTSRLDPPKSGKYVFIEKSYEDDSENDDGEQATSKEGGEELKEPESKLHPAVQDLMKLIFNGEYWSNNLKELNYDANKLPLGKLSKTTITRGFQALKDLSDLLDTARTESASIANLSNLYYSLVPHDFGRYRPPVITSQAMLKKEIDLLESLSDMKDAQNILKDKKSQDEINQLDSQFQGLKMDEMTPLDPQSDEFGYLSSYLLGTKGTTHSVKYQIQQIFRIERQGESARFESSEYMKIPSDRRLLWHGSRVTNFGGILSQGLRIAPPEAPVSGYMFGKGVYLADMSSKSANYCCPYLSGGTGLLLLCEAELGNPMQELTISSYNAGETAKKNGMHTTWGKGRMGPLHWQDAECIHPSLKGCKMPDTDHAVGNTNISNASLYYNEYICYDVAQIRLRYLFRVKM